MGGGICTIYSPRPARLHLILTREPAGRRVEGYIKSKEVSPLFLLLLHHHKVNRHLEKERELENNIKDKNWMDILSSGDPFGKRRLPVDRGIVVISPKAHRLFRPDGIDQARQLILGRACVHDGIERLPGGRPKSGRNSIQRTPGSRIDIYSR